MFHVDGCHRLVEGDVAGTTLRVYMYYENRLFAKKNEGFGW